MTSTPMDSADRYQLLPIEQLLLDHKNPRLILPDNPSQEDLLRKLYEEEALDELAPSFADNGFFAEEPLVVVPSQDRSYWVVVEGNRRLATMKLLLSANLRRSVGVDDWPTIDDAQRDRLQQIPCVIYGEREDVFPYLGFRHITGAKKWDPYQRARFVAQLVESGSTLAEIEELVGDSAKAVKKLYQDYVVHRQVEEETDFPVSALTRRFSLLEVVLNQGPIKQHLGVPRRLPTEQTDYIVPQDRLNELVEVLGWVFGTKELPPVISDSREISKKLSPVVASQEALQHLRKNGNLDEAYERTDGELTYFRRKVRSGSNALESILQLAPLYLGEDSVRDDLDRIVKLSRGIKRLLKDD